jgi:hypothetical protein
MTLNNSHVRSERIVLRDDLSIPSLGIEITNWGFILSLQGQITDSKQNCAMAMCCKTVASLLLRLPHICRQMTMTESNVFLVFLKLTFPLFPYSF